MSRRGSSPPDSAGYRAHLEEQILGGMFRAAGAGEVFDALREEQFETQRHRRILKAIHDARAEAGAVQLDAVKRRLETIDADYLDRIVADAPDESETFRENVQRLAAIEDLAELRGRAGRLVEAKTYPDELAAAAELKEVAQGVTTAPSAAPHEDVGSPGGRGSVPGADAEDGEGPPQKKFMRTDLGNAERLVHRYGRNLRYCHPLRCFLVWNGRRWVRDGSGKAMCLAAQTVRAIYREAAAAGDERERKALAAWAKASESRPRLEAMVAVAQSMIAVAADDLDSDPWLFNCRNGTVDLRTGKLRAHRREDLITKLAPVEYREKAACPLFDAFLDTTLSGNGDLIEFVLRVLGMSLTGDVREQHLYIFHGAGNNGKSVLLDTVAALMGDYATEAPPDLLVVPKGERHATELADLCGRRLVIASETEEGERLRLQLVKRLTGNARIKGRFMRQDFFEFERTHKIVLVTNNKPQVRENTEATWRRLRLVPFDHIVPKEKRDKKLLQRLRAEWPGILARLVAACLRWERDGLTEPEAVLVATEQYRSESDEIALFVSECCVTSPTAWVSSATLREEYEGWCKDRGTRPFGGRAFTDRLRGRGFKPEKRTDRGWLGLGLRAE